MIVPLTDCLIATVTIPFLAAIGVSAALWCKRRRLSLMLARLGLAGGAACSAVLAIVLNGPDQTTESVQVIFGKWFSFSSSHAASITFGLEADFIRACIFGAFGLIGLIALLKANSNLRAFSGDLILTNSLLYAAGAVFIFAPNLAQSLLGWGAISLLAAILMQLLHQRSSFKHTVNDAEGSSFSQRAGQAIGWDQRIVPTIAAMVQFLEWTARQVGQWLTRTIPNWMCEQAELVVESPVNVQLLAAILGTSAILLTWLLMPLG